MTIIKITNNDFLKRMESAEIVLVYEYYNGLQISFGDSNCRYLIETDEYVPHQYEIFEMVKDLEGLKEFGYTSRFKSELYYDSLTVNKNLKTLHLSHMKDMELKQLGNIQNLCLDTFRVTWLNLLPKTLKIIEISSLDVESKEDYNIIIEYFDLHNIDYYFDDYSNWTPEEN
jgi:hypothetical protein